MILEDVLPFIRGQLVQLWKYRDEDYECKYLTNDLTILAQWNACRIDQIQVNQSSGFNQGILAIYVS